MYYNRILYSLVLFYTVLAYSAPIPRLHAVWISLNISSKLATSVTSLPTGSTLQVVPSTEW